MLHSIFAKLSLLAVTAIVAVAGLFGSPKVNPSQNQSIGAQIPVVVSLFETSLQAKIGTSDSSMTLVSGVDRNGTALSGYMCFTLDEGTSNVEFVCGTASGTSVTGLVRGIDPVTGVTSVVALKKAHNRGATVKITNYPTDALYGRLLNGQETIPNPLKYDTSVSTTTLSANTSFLASVAYANSVALQGAPVATTSVPGVVQIGTTAQITAGTGMTGSYTLVPAGSLFSQSWRSATTVPVTNATGTLSAGFIDQTANYTWSGLQTFNGSTTTLATTSFSVIPIMPTATPTVSSQVASKSYVDSLTGTQIWLNRNVIGDSFSVGTTYYTSFNSSAAPTSGSIGSSTLPTAGTLKKFYIKTLAGSPNSTGTTTITVYKNDSATSLAITVPPSPASAIYSDTSDSVGVSAGDNIYLKIVVQAGSGNLVVPSYWLEFTNP